MICESLWRFLEGGEIYFWTCENYFGEVDFESQNQILASNTAKPDIRLLCMLEGGTPRAGMAFADCRLQLGLNSTLVGLNITHQVSLNSAQVNLFTVSSH